MIDHEQVYCDLSLNGAELKDIELLRLSLDFYIDRNFNLGVTLNSEQELQFFEQAQGQPFTLQLSSQDFGPYYFAGILSNVCLLEQKTPGTYTYFLQLEPALENYQDDYFSYLFNGVSVLEISQQILQGLHFNLAPNLQQNFMLQLLGDRQYAPLYRVLMQDETLLSFFKRMLNYHGLSYYFDPKQAQNPLVISDAIDHFAPELSQLEYSNSAASLSLQPFINSFAAINTSSSQNVLCTGAPRLEPQVLLADDELIMDAHYSAALYHLNTNEQCDANTKLRAEIASLAAQGALRRAKIFASGLLLAGSKFKIKDANDVWLISASHTEIVFDPRHAYRLLSIRSEAYLQDANIRYQAQPNFGDHAHILNGIELGTPSTDRGANLISTNEQGHYHATLPVDIDSNDEARDVHVFNIRTLQPMHSDDHSSHMTAPSASEGIMFWSEGFSAEPLLIGTVNNQDSAHPSLEETSQNAYWQDYDTNKLAMINSGQYQPHQKTGRSSASIMEVPSYDALQNASYVRMGDAGAYDQNYQSQAAEPGFFTNSTGHYSEAHQGGIAVLTGNLTQNSQAQGFTPLMRQMFQLQPSAGIYHILDSVTAHAHEELLSSEHAIETYTQDLSTINKTFTGDQNFQSYSMDTVDNVYVNQLHQSQGDVTDFNYNQHTLSTQSMMTRIFESGNQTVENHENYTLNLNHLSNQFNSETRQAYINLQTTQVQQLNQNFSNHIMQIGSANINRQNSIVNASSASIGGSQVLHTGILSLSSGR